MTASSTAIDPIAVQQALIVMQELVALLEEEPGMIGRHDHDSYQQLVLKKQRLLVSYSEKMRSFQSMAHELKALPAQLKIELKSWQEKLLQAVKQNEKTLRIAVQGTKRLVNAIITEIRFENEQTQTYTNREAQLAGNAYHKLSKPVAVDRQI